MLHLEVNVPKGRLSLDERRRLASALTAGEILTGMGGDWIAIDPGILALYESLTHVIVRENDVWVNDGDAVDGGGPVRYIVNVHVGAWAKEMAEHLITSVARQLAEFDGHGEPRAIVQVIGIPDGRYGTGAGVMTTDQFGGKLEEARVRTPDQAVPGTYVDPSCGAMIAVDKAVTVEIDGETFGFCCTGCRGRYVKKRREEAKVG